LIPFLTKRRETGSKAVIDEFVSSVGVGKSCLSINIEYPILNPNFIE
jgi:hypothetical protein